MKHVTIYTDGSCIGNPGPGGWAAILNYKGYIKEISGGCENTTNNRMELTAVLKGLEVLTEPCEVTVISDSKYVVNAVNKGWLNNWVMEEFENRRNKDLWMEVVELAKIHFVELCWVKGHSGNIHNERCDKLAKKEARKFLGENGMNTEKAI